MFICFHSLYNINNKLRVLKKKKSPFHLIPLLPQLSLCCDHFKLWFQLNPAELLIKVALIQEASPSHLEANKLIFSKLTTQQVRKVWIALSAQVAEPRVVHWRSTTDVR